MSSPATPAGRWRWAALLTGPLLGLAPLLLPAPAALGEAAWRLAGLAAWMVIWWLTEAVPIPATALLPIPLMPLLGIASENDTVASYAHPLIFLFFGGFVLAGAMERWGLHRRIALALVTRLGGGAAGIVGGFMAATAFLSMWISNTATALLMFTIAVSLLDSGTLGLRRDAAPFGRALLLGVAYSASIGGTATLIGTPPNALAASFLADAYGIEMTMSRWLLFGLPYVALMLPLTWLWLTRGAFDLGGLELGAAREHLAAELARLGRAGREERFVLGVFAATAAAWILRGPLVAATGWPVTDTTLALVAALVLLTVPLSIAERRFAVDWPTVEGLPWGVLILFGGGLALATGFEASGLAAVIGAAVGGLGDLGTGVLVLGVTAVIVLLTELTSNTATAATFLPVVGAVAVGLDISPLLLVVPVAMGASAAFMMPVATPPNAIVFAYRELRIADMVRAGALVNVLSIATIVLVVWAASRLWAG